jgi:membrane fusion protein, multidrug efflux system
MQIMNSLKLIGSVGIIAGSLLAGGCAKKPASAPPPAGPPEVGIMEIQPQRVALTSELSGRTAPMMIAEVRPQVNGIVQKRVFTEGSDVKSGQLLYQIDPASYQAAFDSARAAQARAEATLGALKLKEERYRDLVKIKAVSQQDYDDAHALLKQSEADVAAAKAAVQTARINLGYTKVVAPISGRIGRSAVTDGALVTASQQAPLSTIQQLDSMYVDVTQSTSDLLRLRQNLAKGVLRKDGANQAKVKLVLEDGSPYPQSGTLKFSEVTVDQSTGSVTLRAIFPNPNQTLLPGMFVRALIEEGVNDAAILVPQRGVSRNAKGEAVVMTVDPEGKVAPRPVKVVRTVGDSWLVSEGLKAGDRVILDGLQKAKPGSPVKAVPFTQQAGAAGSAAPRPAAPAAPATQPAAAQQPAAQKK